MSNKKYILGDCMEYLKEYKDNHFDLAIVDPPYGLGNRLIKGGRKGGMGTLRKLADNKVSTWDNKIPTKKYFKQLIRISKKQIIWGGNYFLDYLSSTDGFIVWDKMNGTNPMADAEIAWQNIKGTTRMFRMHHFSSGYGKKIHPTQKPIKLYRWLLQNYAKKNDLILDTHVGSASSLIACEIEGFNYVGFEKDKDYFRDSNKRIKQHLSQITMF